MRGLLLWRSSLPKRARGFSLVELLAVAGATMLMGALAVSAYRTYMVRAQIAAGVAGAAGVQARVVRAFKRDGTPPRDRHAANLPADAANEVTAYVESVEIVDGRVELRFGQRAAEAIKGRVLSLTPFETAEQEVVWVCGNRRPGVGLQPMGFAAGGRQATQVPTTIDARYLPSMCR